MNKNLVDNEHLLKIKSFFKIWSRESFNKELPFYKEIDRINQKNNTSNDLNSQFNFSSYEEFINQIEDKKGKGLKDFLLALGQNTISSDYQIIDHESDKKVTNFSLGFEEGSFFNIITSPDFYEKFFLEKREKQFEKIFGKTFDDWFVDLDWEELSLNIRINDEEQIVKLLTEHVPTDQNVNMIAAYLVENELKSEDKKSSNSKDKNSSDSKNNKQALIGKIAKDREGTEVTWTKRKKQIKYRGWIIETKGKSNERVKVYIAGNNNYYIDQNTDYYIRPFNKQTFRDKMFNFAIQAYRQGDKKDLIDLSTIYKDYESQLKEEINNKKPLIVETFKDGVKKGIEACEDKDVEETASTKFKNWWNDSGKSAFERMLDDETTINEITYMLIKITTGNQLKGNLGEILCGILATVATGQKTKILGRTLTERGKQHATDLMIVFKNAKNNLEALGAQIKTFPSAEKVGEQVFYEQSNQIGDDNINRYLNPKEDRQKPGNKILKILIKEYCKNENRYNPLENFLFSKTENYLRYREGSPLKKKAEAMVENIRNNFYIFNFRIIPASLIFYFLEQSLTTNNLSDLSKIFYFSETETNEEGEQSKTSWTTLKESLDNIFPQKKGDFSAYDKVYLNFVGLTIRFKGITGNNLVNFAI